MNDKTSFQMFEKFRAVARGVGLSDDDVISWLGRTDFFEGKHPRIFILSLLEVPTPQISIVLVHQFRIVGQIDVRFFDPSADKDAVKNELQEKSFNLYCRLRREYPDTPVFASAAATSRDLNRRFRAENLAGGKYYTYYTRLTMSYILYIHEQGFILPMNNLEKELINCGAAERAMQFASQKEAEHVRDRLKLKHSDIQVCTYDARDNSVIYDIESL